MLGAYAHQDLPFEQLVEELRPAARPAAARRCFQVIFQPPDGAGGRRSGAAGAVAASRSTADAGTAKFDLTLDLCEAGGGLAGGFEYDADLFDAATIAAHGRPLRDAAARPGRGRARTAASPSCRCSTAAERAAAPGRVEPGPAAVEHDRTCLHRLFDAAGGPRARSRWRWSVRRRAARPTASSTARANRLARRLRGARASGRRCGWRSASSARRSWWSPSSASSRPAAPTCRSTRPIRPSGWPSCWRTRAPLLLVDRRRWRERCRRDARDASASTPSCDGSAGERRARRSAAVEPDHPGLRHLHLGLDRPAEGRGGHARQRRRGCSRRPQPGSASAPDDVWTLFHSYAFDFSVWEIWGALLYGGRLVVVPYGVEPLAGATSTALLATERVTVLNQTPSAFRQLVAADGGDGGRAAARAALGDLRRRGARAAPASRPGSSATATSARGWSTCTASPRRRCTSPTGRCARRDLAGRRAARSAVPIPDLAVHLLDPRRPAGAGRRAGRDPRRRRRAGARLPRPAGADGRALRPRSVRRRAGRAALPHRRPGAPAAGRRRSSTSAASTTR